ncbi:RDAC family protein [Lacrimispora sp. 38-1]|uniref:RDAC family protein n=1 Tax=Lacrimispora sp. 38-1 TaxID=3125778 RepID=UPI003CEA95B1
MKIVSFGEILECNQLLKDSGLEFKIHLRDACGKQSCFVESLSDSNGTKQYQALYETLEAYFEKLRFRLEYNADKTDFWMI